MPQNPIQFRTPGGGANTEPSRNRWTTGLFATRQEHGRGDTGVKHNSSRLKATEKETPAKPSDPDSRKTKIPRRLSTNGGQRDEAWRIGKPAIVS